MKTRKQKTLSILIIVVTVVLLLVSGMYFFRETLLQKTLSNITKKMDVTYNCDFSVKEAHFQGLSGIKITQIILAPKKADTLLNIKKIEIKVAFLSLLVGEIQLETLKINDGFIQLTKKGKVKNFDAFFKRDTPKIEQNTKRDYADFTYHIISKVLNLVPTDMKVQHLVFKLDDNGKKTQLMINTLILINRQLDTNLNIETNTFAQNWSIKGFADPRNKKADLRFFNLDSGAIKVPYLDERYNLIASFDSIRLKIDNIDKSLGKLKIEGFSSVVNLKLMHPKIANKDVIVKNARFDYRFLVGENFVSIDSSSTIKLNQIKLHPYLSCQTEKDTIYTLKVAIPKMPAQHFINSLPEGLFTHFEGMQATGNFDYKLNFLFNKNKPNTLVFDSKLNKENFKITQYGEANLNKLNGPFTYRAIINNIPQRGILVGNGNPNYTPLDQISPYLQKSVLTSEDPSFFSHRGFINEAFKQSILKNIRTKKFSRGASTISMQLVKNVFLTREKTLSRKLEEILLVYILENNRVVSKERMLEVYFNIIEWGPNVYGIAEASHFYFQKSPSELTLNECLFLGSIIPSPKKFMYKFDNQGNLQDFAIKNDKFLKSLMIRRGILISDDTIGRKSIEVTGTARSFLRIKVTDSLAINKDSIKKTAKFEL